MTMIRIICFEYVKINDLSKYLSYCVLYSLILFKCVYCSDVYYCHLLVAALPCSDFCVTLFDVEPLNK